MIRHMRLLKECQQHYCEVELVSGLLITFSTTTATTLCIRPFCSEVIEKAFASITAAIQHHKNKRDEYLSSE